MHSIYREKLLFLAKEAGKIIRSDFSSEMSKRWKEGVTPVTQTDLKINALARAYIQENFPDHGIVGHKRQTDYCWQWDPIDGTVGFTHGIPACVFSIALLYKGESMVGAVYDPFMDRFYYAEKGQGATLNANPIHITPSYSLKSKVVGICAGHLESLDLGKLHNALRETGCKVVNVYSVIYMGALVASGELTATIFGGNMCEDGAAIKVIVEEAGGRVTDLSGSDQRYDVPIHGFIASNGMVHDQLVDLIRDKAACP